MGVHGLKNWMLQYRRDCLVEHKLHNCRVMIDGNNLAYLLYTNAVGIESAFGGDYDKYAAHVAVFFTGLLECNIDVIVLMDGGQPQNNLKQHTCSTRLQDSLNLCLQLKPFKTCVRTFPLHGRSVFISVLKRMGIFVLQCDFEADEDLSYLAKRFSAKVISNDSDFFLHDVDFLLLDSLKYTSVKHRPDADGNAYAFMKSTIFDRKRFLQLSRLEQRHLRLVGALSGNDCAPLPLLHSFHAYLANGGRHKKVRGYTRRQHAIALVLALLAQHRHAPQHQVIQMVLVHVGGDMRPKLQRILEHICASYAPKNSTLTYWLRQREQGQKEVQRRDQQQKEKVGIARLQEEEGSGHQEKGEEHGREQKQEGKRKHQQEERKVVKEIHRSQQEGHQNVQEMMMGQERQKEEQFQQEQQKDTKDQDGTNEEIDVFRYCNCGELWRGLIDDNVDEMMLNGIRDGYENFPSINSVEDKNSQSCDQEKLNETDDLDCDNTSFVANSDESGDEDGESVDDEGESNGGNSDVRTIDISDKNNFSPTDNIEPTNLSAEASEEEQPISDNIQNVPDDIQHMSKKKRKREMEKLKYLERKRKQYTRKLQAAGDATAIKDHDEKEAPSDDFYCDGMDAHQVIRFLEIKEENDKLQKENEAVFAYSKDNSSPKLPVQNSNVCPHSQSLLVTASGYRLEGWLVYGFRHCIVGREVSDIVTNGFCISPPQIEVAEESSCYRLLQRVITVIVQLVIGCGSDQYKDVDGKQVDGFCGDVSVVEDKIQSESTNDVSEISSAGDNGKIHKCNKRKQKEKRKQEVLHWFIRGETNLLIEDIILNDPHIQLNKIPSLKIVGTLCLNDRKSVYLKIISKHYGTDMKQLLELPKEFQLMMSFISFWYKNSELDVDENHVLSLLLCVFMFYVIDGRTNRSRKGGAGSGHGVFCLHCVLRGLSDKGVHTSAARLHCLNKPAASEKGKKKGREQSKQPQSKRFKNKSKAKGKKSSDQVKPTNIADALVPKDDANTLQSDAEPNIQNLIKQCNIADKPKTNDVDTKKRPTDRNLKDEMTIVTFAIREEECTAASARLSRLHTVCIRGNEVFNRYFVHSMSEYQACVHYMSLLNGVLLAPFTPLSMDCLWSGSFCYSVYTQLLGHEACGLEIVLLLLGIHSNLAKLFVLLYGFLNKSLGLGVDIQDFSEISEEEVVERVVEFVNSTLKDEKNNAKENTNKKRTAKMQKGAAMDIDEGCNVRILSSVL